MHPILFEIPLFEGLTIYSYGVMVAFGFVAGILWIIHETRRLGKNTSAALDLVFYIIVAAILGSRLLFLIVNDPARLITEPWSLFMLWEGGLVFYGGLLAAIIVAAIYLKKKRLHILSYMDIFAPAIALGHAFGRLGCLLAGCCHGRPAGSFWLAIVFPDQPHTFAPPNVPLYPTQIIESVGELIIFFILVLFRKHKKFEGQVIALYLMLYSLLRFFNEMLRGDLDRGYIIDHILSTSQGVSILLFALGLIIMIWGYRKIRGANE